MGIEKETKANDHEARAKEVAKPRSMKFVELTTAPRNRRSSIDAISAAFGHEPRVWVRAEPGELRVDGQAGFKHRHTEEIELGAVHVFERVTFGCGCTAARMLRAVNVPLENIEREHWLGELCKAHGERPIKPEGPLSEFTVEELHAEIAARTKKESFQEPEPEPEPEPIEEPKETDDDDPDESEWTSD